VQKPRLTLALVCIAVFIGSVDLTVVSAVLPRIVTDLEVSIDTELNHAAWVVSGYLLTYTISLTFMGRLSDLFGRRRLYFICLVIFIIGSGVAAAATTLNGVIAGRVVQAFGAGAIVPIAMALVGDLFPPAQRAPALGFVGAVETVGWLVGHLYGGVLMWAFDDWRLLFWINIPAGLLALALTWGSLRDVPINRTEGSFDWLGAVLIAASLTALNVGLSAGAEVGQTDFYGEARGIPPYTLPLLVAALVLLAAFIWNERRTPSPLLNLGLITARTPGAACIVNAFFGFALAIALTNVPLFINARLGLSDPTNPDILRQAAWDSGWMLAALTLTMGAVAVPGGWLTNRAGLRRTTLLGMALALAGFVLMNTWQADVGYPRMAAHLVLTGTGLGLVLSPVATAVINVAPAGQRGSASALVITLRLVGMTIGISVLTLWGMQRQDMLRRTGADNPQAMSDPAGFLLDVTTQVVGETFLLAGAACLLALLAALALAHSRDAPA
jgi:EmrB/QacA subfamily drug resistance transporter